jgi:TonB family protein
MFRRDSSFVAPRRLGLAAWVALTVALGGAFPLEAAAQCVRTGVPLPQKVLHVDPVYPPAAIALRVQGIVILDIEVDAPGAVLSARVLRSIPLLDAAAVAAVLQWRFQPRAAGSPCVIMSVTVLFNLPADNTAPSNLQASVNGNLLSLTWVAPTTVPAAYRIEAGTGAGLTDIGAVTVPASPTGLTTPVPNGTYFIRVRAVHQGTPSAPSNEVSVTVGCAAPPPAPTTFAVVQGPGGNSLHFSWAIPSTPVDFYRLEAGSATGRADLATVTLGGSATQFDVQAPQGTFFVRLRAQNACGTSAPSPELVVTVGTPCVAPSAPMLAATVSGQNVTLVWSPPSTGTPPIAYTLLAGSRPGAADLTTAPMGSLTSFQARVPAGTYYVRVVAANACGTSTASNEATVVVGMTTGAPSLTFAITPNPVPFTGVFPGCAGSPTAGKTWLYTLRITNQGSGPFTIGSFSARVTSPLLPVPVDVPYSASMFVAAFGGSTIVPQGSLQGPLCVIGHYDDATLAWTFVDGGGASFTTPVIRFLRSPF